MFSSLSSESDSMATDATRLELGVLRGWPGGAIAPARFCVGPTCLLGVTGGTGTETATTAGCGGVANCPSISCGGVTGATRVVVAVAKAAAACVRRSSSTAAHLDHSSCFRYMYCCCGPTTLPGRTMRMNAIASFAVNPYFQIRYAPMRVPVRPRPALHCDQVRKHDAFTVETNNRHT